MCPECAAPTNSGLCSSEHCRREVLPQQKSPSWHRDAHSSLYYELGSRRVDELELSPAGRRIKHRKERKIVRAAARLINGVAGSATRTKTRHRTATG